MVDSKYVKFILETSGYGIVTLVAVSFYKGLDAGLQAGLFAAGLIALTKGIYFAIGALLGAFGVKEFEALSNSLAHIAVKRK